MPGANRIKNKTSHSQIKLRVTDQLITRIDVIVRDSYSNVTTDIL